MTRKKRTWISECTYCGETATESDHVTPHNGQAESGIPCCRECNSLLSNFFAYRVSHKAELVGIRLEQRYRKVLDQPGWGDEELTASLEPSMRQYVRAKQALRLRILNRLRHTNAVIALDPDIWQVHERDEKGLPLV